MRGKHGDRPAPKCDARITPAHAGKTASCVIRPATGADHPRACGENLITIEYEFRKGGSPPRMRGKPKMSLQ